MGKLNMPAEELESLKSLIPEHLHRWIDYLPEPEPEYVMTPNEERNGLTPGMVIPGLTDRPKQAPAPKTRAPSFPTLGGSEPAPKATLKSRPGLNAKKPLAEPQGVDLQKALLDLALSDEDDNA